MSSFIDEKEKVTEETQTMIQDYRAKKRKYFVVLVLIGLLNNFGFVLVNSSAQKLGKSFQQENLMTLFTFCLTSLSIVTALINSKYCLKIRHFTKIKIMLTLYTIAYLIVGISNIYSNFTGFVFCLIGSVIMGGAGTFGEQTVLGFLKGFAPDLISGWACGTGFAGVIGTAVNLLLRHFDVPNYLIFLGMIPTNIVYYICFAWLKDQKVHQMVEAEHHYLEANTGSRNNITDEDAIAQETDKQESNINQTLTCENFTRLLPKIWYYSFNLGMVYFLEYTIITGFADESTKHLSESKNFIEKESFILLNLCYQIGVLISRSSLEVIKIKRVWIITFLQFINFWVWSWIGWTKGTSLEVNFILMIWVGLMGGSSYVNVYYLVLESDKVEKKDKEMSVNIVGMGNNVGVLSATLTALALENTIYAHH